MHLQNTTPTLSDAAKEIRVNIWYSIVSLEQVLSVMTSRPPMVHDRDCNVSLPSLNSQDQALADQKPGFESVSTRDFARRTSSLSLSWPAFGSGSGSAGQQPSLLASRRLKSTIYFRCYVEINAFAQLAVSQLYNPEIRHLKWSEIQKRIRELDEKLLEWASNLPKTVNLQDPFPSDAAGKKEPLQRALGILFYGTRTIINRPTLCRLDRLIIRQSDMSRDINRDMAKKCVHSAQAILAFLPDEPELDIIYSGPLWWAMHRHLKRAGTVLLLELAFRARDMPSEWEQLLSDAKKAVSWLRAMARTSPPAEQCWIALSGPLKRAGQRVGGDMTDIDPPNAQRRQQQRRQGQQQRNPVHQRRQHQRQHQQSPPPIRSATHAVGGFSASPEAWEPLDDTFGRDLQMPSYYFGDLETLELDQFGFPHAGSDMANLFPTASEMHDSRADDNGDELLEEGEMGGLEGGRDGRVGRG